MRRDLVKSVFRRAGIEVRRSGGGGPRGTLAEVLANATANGLAPGTVIDVGVAWGTPELYDGLPGARLFLVEPLAEYEDAIRDICSQRGAEYVLGAAGSEAGELDIAVHRVGALSSTLGAREGDVDDATATRTVPVHRLDELVSERGLRGPYVIKADVEGAELAVLEGAAGILDRTELVLLETSLFRFWPDAPLLGDVVAWMRERGFAVYDLYGGHVRPLDGALAQIDVAFAREDGPLRARHDYATPGQADELYRSWGL